jgi:hypothetical protein
MSRRPEGSSPAVFSRSRASRAASSQSPLEYAAKPRLMESAVDRALVYQRPTATESVASPKIPSHCHRLRMCRMDVRYCSKELGERTSESKRQQFAEASLFRMFTFSSRAISECDLVRPLKSDMALACGNGRMSRQYHHALKTDKPTRRHVRANAHTKEPFRRPRLAFLGAALACARGRLLRAATLDITIIGCKRED